MENTNDDDDDMEMQAESSPRSSNGSAPRDGSEDRMSQDPLPGQFVARHCPVIASHGGFGGGAALGASVAGGPLPSEGMQPVAVAAEAAAGGGEAEEVVMSEAREEAGTEEERNVPDLNEMVEEPPQPAEELYPPVPDLNLPPVLDENQA